MQKMTQSLVRRGRTGPQSYRSPVKGTSARPLSRATTAAAVEHAGIKTSKKFNTDYIRMILNKIHRNQGHKLQDPRARVQAASPIVQGTSNKDKGIFFMLNMK